MTEPTKPVSIRLRQAEIEQLQVRAHKLQASVTGIARELIRTGLEGGDNRALADRLRQIERRLVALEQQARETGATLQSTDKAARDLLAMFDALLKALTGDNNGRTP
ncbi:hypothetical protein [Nitratireductor sp. XY-223]|uniref:hypothetical protein n=1 Tax=Nitratireductor sp. XY-223 TaxID=2561926 RepID=UPI0010A9BC6E|nr:hypothetical protein [Nitratireductor sp. XY-223]